MLRYVDMLRALGRRRSAGERRPDDAHDEAGTTAGSLATIADAVTGEPHATSSHCHACLVPAFGGAG